MSLLRHCFFLWLPNGISFPQSRLLEVVNLHVLLTILVVTTTEFTYLPVQDHREDSDQKGPLSGKAVSVPESHGKGFLFTM